MGRQKTILLIDDDLDLQQLIKITLKSKGYSVVTADNGVEGLAQLKTLKPDLIILDINMPVMGGVEFYRKISDKEQSLYPVLVLTARANMESLFRDFNVDGFIDKPFEIDELVAEIERIINKQAETAKSPAVTAEQPLKVCIAEYDQEMFNKIGMAFLNAGYVVAPVRSDSEAIERISSTMPDVVLMNLALIDIPWEVVIVKLKKAVQTRDIKLVVYAEQTPAHAAAVKKMDPKEGVDDCVLYTDIQHLVDSVHALLRA